MTHYTKPEALDLSALSFEEAGSQGKRRLIIKQGEARLALKLKGLRAPFGLGLFKNADGTFNYSLNLSVETESELHKVLKDVEKRVVEEVGKNAELLGKKKKLSAEVLASLFTPVLKESAGYEPTLKLKLPRDKESDKYEFGLFGRGGERLCAEEVLKKGRDGQGARFSACITCTGVWFNGGKFGVTWRVDQLLLAAPAPPPARNRPALDVYQFSDEE